MTRGTLPCDTDHGHLLPSSGKVLWNIRDTLFDDHIRRCPFRTRVSDDNLPGYAEAYIVSLSFIFGPIEFFEDQRAGYLLGQIEKTLWG